MDFSDSDFNKKVLESPIPVVVDFGAEWCNPCKQLIPVIDQLQTELAGRVSFIKLDVDKSPKIAANLGVRSIPTLIIFSKGEEKDRLIGTLPKSQIIRRIEPFAKSKLS